MSLSRAIAANQRPFIMRAGISKLADLADGAGALASILAAGGDVFYCDPTNGTSTGGATSPDTANSNLKTVFDLTTDNHNDVVFFIGGATAYNPTAAFDWDHSYTHLIGLNSALPGVGARSRIVNSTANDLAVLFTLSGNGCIIANMKFSDEKDNAADGACVLVSGSRNHLINCEFAGMANATASGPFSRAGSYSLKVTGEENAVSGGSIGVDTVARTAANAELIVSGARNRFIGCDIRSNSTTAGKFLVKVDSSGGDLRDVQFQDVLFFNYSTNWATGITDAINASITNTAFIILRGNCQFVGTGMGVADTVTRVYGAGAAPNAGMFLSTQPTT